ncbi:MAG: RNA polymerase sigma-70 factor [Prolixibacteraceae bacterium]|nr:RNA polymerase sigma-70 factor [Prolixibacteraceae bacterium]
METGNQAKELFIFEELKRGKEYAFDFFFNYYYPGLCVYAQKIIELPEPEAKDIVQDVFVKLWNDRKKLDVQISVRSYLFVAVKNKCFDVLRKKKRSVKLQEITHQHDIADESFDGYVLCELEIIFDNGLKKLPDRCREIFELSRLQGLKNREIAEKLNLSEKTVENQMTKALRILKEELKDYLPLLALFEIFHFLR